MTIYELLKEYNLEIDDIRWYLSKLESQILSELSKKPKELNQYIWSGELADNLYNMEERYIDELQDQIERKITDESDIRDILKEVELAAIKRRSE